MGLTSPFRQPGQYLTPIAWELMFFCKIQMMKDACKKKLDNGRFLVKTREALKLDPGDALRRILQRVDLISS